MMETQAKCPYCSYIGRPKNIKLLSKVGYDPLMVNVKCPRCEKKWFLAPELNYKEEALNVHNS